MEISAAIISDFPKLSILDVCGVPSFVSGHLDLKKVNIHLSILIFEKSLRDLLRTLSNICGGAVL